jgi:hypothetical protein
MRPRLSAALLCLSATLALAGLSLAPGETTPPGVAADNLSYHFDFEEHTEWAEFPDGWELVVGRNHPQDIRAKWDPSQHHSGDASFLIDLDGISNVYETAKTVRVILDPRIGYRLSGWIRTKGVPSSGLRRTVARFEILGIARDEKTVLFTAQTPGVTGDREWTEVSLDIPSDITRPFRLVRIRCVIDGIAIGGKVWFDDITLQPVPGMRVQGGHPDGFYSPSDRARVKVCLDTLIGGDYRLDATLLGPAGEPVWKQSIVPVRQPGFIAETEFDLTFKSFGVYRLRAELRSGNVLLASWDHAMLYWRGTPATSPGSIGVDAGTVERFDFTRLSLLVAGGFGHATFDLFDPTATALTAANPMQAAGPHLGRLRQGFCDSVMVLARVPDNLTAELLAAGRIGDTADAVWPRVLLTDAKSWSPYVTSCVMALSDSGACWQVGAAPDATLTAEEIYRAVTNLRKLLTPYTYRRRIGVVMSGAESEEVIRAARTCDFIVFRTAPDVDAERVLPATVAALKATGRDVWVSIPLAEDAKPERKSAVDAVMRAVRARGAGAERVTFDSLATGLLDPSGQPREVMSALSAAARELGDLPCRGRLDTRASAFLFESPDRAVLAVIPAGTGPADELYLGSDLRRIDLDGNAAPMSLRGDRASLENSGEPYYVEGIDAAALLTRLSLKVTAVGSKDAELPADVRPQTLQVELTNHYATAVAGSIELTAPEGWKVKPSTFALRIEPGATVKLKTVAEIPVTESAGERTLTAKLNLAGRDHLIRRGLIMSPRDVETDVTVVPSTGGGLTVIQRVTNRGRRPVRIALFVASAAGKQDQFLNGIAPGRTAEARFTVPRSAVSGKVWAGWREIDGTRFYNRYLDPR